MNSFWPFRFAAPEWLLLTLVVLAMLYKFRSQIDRQLARAGLLFLLVLALAAPELRLPLRQVVIWALFDRSDSVRDELESKKAEWVRILRDAKPANGELHRVDFAGDAALVPKDKEEAEIKRFNQSRLAAALRFVHSLFQDEHDNRLILFSDGFATDSLSGTMRLLSEEEAPLYLRTVASPNRPDALVRDLRLPREISSDDPFLIEAELRTNRDASLRVLLERDGTLVAEQTVPNSYGLARVQFLDRVREFGKAYRYTVRVESPGDAYPENNSRTAWLTTRGPSRVLLLTRYSNDPIKTALNRQGVLVQQLTVPKQPSLGDLATARALIINDVSASELGRDFLSAVRFFVESQGGGLMLVGGENSFGSGGYFNSPIDSVLPVSTELREEERLQPAAIMYVLDRSGSMGVPVGGNMGNMTKMDLANEGTARSIDLLSPRDMIGINAVDSTTHGIATLQEIGSDRDKLLSLSRSVRSAGGGIFVYTGLKDAWEQLKLVPSKYVRHVILFSDAADSEEPGQYEKLLEEMKERDATVSVIGLGRPSDPDAEFLRDIAERGEGRIFFVANAIELPAVFAQETVSVSRSQYIDEPTATNVVAGWKAISAQELKWSSAVDGYNVNYLRGKASAPLLAQDEYRSPLFAYWQHQRGRSIALSFPIFPAASISSWDAFQQMLGSSTRWLMRPDLPAGLTLRISPMGEYFELELFYDASWSKRLAAGLPEVHLFSPNNSENEELRDSQPWSRVEAGRLVAKLPIATGETRNGVIQFEKFSIPFGPLEGSDNAEFNREGSVLRELRSIVAGSGGSEKFELASLWEGSEKPRWLPLRDFFLWIFLFFFLVDTLLSRLGVRLLSRTERFAFVESLRGVSIRELFAFRWSRTQRSSATMRDPNPSKASQGAGVSAVSSSEAEQGDKSKTHARDRFARAKRRGV